LFPARPTLRGKSDAWRHDGGAVTSRRRRCGAFGILARLLIFRITNNRERI